MSELIIEDEYKKYKDDTPVTVERQNTGDSPCDGCKNKNGNKDICSEHCMRLSAFQYNRPFRHLPYYQKTVTSPQIAPPLQEKVETAKPRTTEVTPWQKAMPIKMKLAQKPKPTIPAPMTYGEKLKIIADTSVCLVCGRDKSKYPLRRGLCLARCSGAWRDGRITHPLLGVFSKMTRKEVNNARYGKHEECLMPNCHEVGNRRGLCQKCYRKWIGNKLLHPKLGKWFKKDNKKKEVDVEEQAIYETTKPEKKEQPVNYEINLQTKDEVSVEGTTVTLDFAGYQTIYGELKAQAELTRLPISHVLMNVLALGIMATHDEEKRRKESK